MIVAKNETLKRADETLKRADALLVTKEGVFAAELKAVHDDLWMTHAVYMPRVLAGVLLCALRRDAESQGTGSKELNALINVHVYELGKGLGMPLNKRVFTPDALEFLGVWSYSDVQSVHKGVESLFSDLSTPHHVIVDGAQGPGSVISGRGEPFTTAEVIFFYVGMKVLERTRKHVPGTPWPTVLENVPTVLGMKVLEQMGGRIFFDPRRLGQPTTTSGPFSNIVT